MPKLSAHQQAQIVRFVRLLGVFLATSGIADQLVNSTQLRVLIGGTGIATVEVLIRQFRKVTPAAAK